MLALIAGQGRLPELVAEAVPDVVVTSLAAFTPENLTPDITFRLETLGSLFGDLKACGVSRICLAGTVRRMIIEPDLIDDATKPLVPRVLKAMQQGDDGALRLIMGLIEEAGFEVVAAQDLVALMPEEGVLTRAQPTPQDAEDAARGAEIVAAMAAADVGQACVIEARQARALEAVSGTAWMLASLEASQGTGLLYKAAKPAQDMRADVPTIGPDTIAQAARAGLRGVVIAQGSVLVLDLADTVKAADEAGLFLWVR